MTPRYRFSSNLMIYARVASGYRVGGPNAGATLGFAGVRNRFEQGPELMAGKVSSVRPLTSENTGLPASVAVRSVTWQNDGRELQGWLLTPRKVDPSRKMPMVVVVHGGPAGYGGPEFVWDGWRQALVDKGYALFYPNFRGSASRGEARRGEARRPSRPISSTSARAISAIS